MGVCRSLGIFSYMHFDDDELMICIDIHLVSPKLPGRPLNKVLHEEPAFRHVQGGGSS